jgi:hypothetical protein
MASNQLKLHVIILNPRKFLKDKKLRNVDKSQWKLEIDIDENGNRKVT